ncbi:RNA pseudouridine synthase [Bhargavaea cecembensis]|uniref:RNA pseudouridylate synthase n=1 Tax=Bhargavaea cecembensis TaxID=394098 RepID=A0A161SK39_9BACL|nr:RluA family pseudouridine synthase [Bhargavaea cecembensis]KZE37733.1 RNA pseudouridine synthase [Bhargavaea cecembensis]
MSIAIIYEDNHLLVVEKPVNMPVQEDRTGDMDLLNALKEMIKDRDNKPGNVYLGLVHRLDRPVGGAIVFAKTSKAASRLSDILRRRDMDREYIAVVRGNPPKENGRLEHHLLKDKKENKVSVVKPGVKEAKKAVLNYEVLGRKGDLTLVSVRLETGRPHQIRVQLSAIGCPLYGDQKYGASVNRPGQQIALWSRSLSFTHPVKKEPVCVTSLPPSAEPWSYWSLS